MIVFLSTVVLLPCPVASDGVLCDPCLVGVQGSHPRLPDPLERWGPWWRKYHKLVYHQCSNRRYKPLSDDMGSWGFSMGDQRSLAHFRWVTAVRPLSTRMGLSYATSCAFHDNAHTRPCSCMSSINTEPTSALSAESLYTSGTSSWRSASCHQS